MSHVRSLFCLCLLLPASAVWPQEASDADVIMDLEARWSEIFAAGDVDGLMALMASRSTLLMPGSSPITDLDRIRNATAELMSSRDTASWKPDYAFVAPSGDMAYDYGTVTTTTAAGEKVARYCVVVWVLEEGTWKVAAEMFD